MSFFSQLFTSNSDKLITSIGDTLDKTITSKEEKMNVYAQIQKNVQEFSVDILDQANKIDHEITKRLESDNRGSWLTRNVRPLVFLLTFSVTIFLVLFRPEQQAQALEYMVNLLEGMCYFYFGSRGVEKVVKTLKNVSSFDTAVGNTIESSNAGFLSKLFKK
jgi:hypothetical protein